jgi:hypothetical protein
MVFQWEEIDGFPVGIPDAGTLVYSRSTPITSPHHTGWWVFDGSSWIQLMAHLTAKRCVVVQTSRKP